MDKQKEREIGKLHLNLKLLNTQVKEWNKILQFLKKRKGINEGRDRLIKEASIERHKVRVKMQELIKKLRT